MDEILKIQMYRRGRLGPLRYVYDKVSVHVRGLALMGVSSKEYGSLLIIMSKLPSDVHLQISSSEFWKIDELLQFIRSEIDAREAIKGVKIERC